MSKPTVDPFTNAVVYAPATVQAQLGGALYDRLLNIMATSSYLPRKLVEPLLLYVEVAVVGLPEWILGETNGEAPPVEKRIESSIAASRMIMADTVARGGRRKVAVLTGKRKKGQWEKELSLTARILRALFYLTISNDFCVFPFVDMGVCVYYSGGASGLGLVTAKAIAEAGYHVIVGKSEQHAWRSVLTQTSTLSVSLELTTVLLLF